MEVGRGLQAQRLCRLATPLGLQQRLLCNNASGQSFLCSNVNQDIILYRFILVNFLYVCSSGLQLTSVFPFERTSKHC